MILDREVLFKKIRLLGLLVFVCSLPFSKSANNIAIIVLAINWIFEDRFSVKWDRFNNNKVLLLCFCSIYILSVLGLIYTENMRQGLFELEKNATILLFPLIFASSKPLEKNEIRILFKALILACIIASIVCLGYAVYRNYEEGHTLTYVFNAIFYDIHLPGRYEYFNYYYFIYYFLTDPLGIHPIYLAMYTLFSSCLVIWLWWDRSKFKEELSWIFIFLLIYNSIIIVLLSSRTQMFSLIILGTIFVFYYCYRRRIIYKGILLICFLTVLFFSLILLNPVSRERFSKAISPTSHYTENEHGEGGLSLRLYQWKYSIKAIQENLLLGSGPGDAQDVLEEVYLKSDFKIGYDNQLNPHNQYLQTWLESGIIGLLILLACMLLPVYFAINEKQWIYLVFIFILAVGFVTESMLELNKGIIFYSFFNSLFAFNFIKKKKLVQE